MQHARKAHSCKHLHDSKAYRCRRCTTPRSASPMLCYMPSRTQPLLQVLTRLDNTAAAQGLPRATVSAGQVRETQHAGKRAPLTHIVPTGGNSASLCTAPCRTGEWTGPPTWESSAVEHWSRRSPALTQPDAPVQEHAGPLLKRPLHGAILHWHRRLQWDSAQIRASVTHTAPFFCTAKRTVVKENCRRTGLRLLMDESVASRGSSSSSLATTVSLMLVDSKWLPVSAAVRGAEAPLFGVAAAAVNALAPRTGVTWFPLAASKESDSVGCSAERALDAKSGSRSPK
jgi:hypothetical protein